jgi:cobalt-zinc-cadmium efflux system membrane fusion protein
MKRNSLLRLPVAVLAAVGLLAACTARRPSADAPAGRPTNLTLAPDQRARIDTRVVERRPFRPAVEATGTVAFDGDQSTQVLAPISGPVARLLAPLGARVRKGQPLATVASPDFAAAVSAVRKAEAEARNARRIADLDQKLFDSDGLSRRDLDQAQTDAESAEADRDAAILALGSLGVDRPTIDAIRRGEPIASSESAIRSPIDGTLVERLISPGQLLQAGATPCFTVADLSQMWVMANVFETDLAMVAIGDPAQIAVGSANTTVSGTVDYIAALVDPVTRAVAVRILAPNPGGVLKKDLYVRVWIHSRRERQGLLVPTSSVLRDDENLPFVYVVEPDGSFARRPVRLGARVGDQYEVTAGLRAGDRIVVEGGLFLQFAQSQ